jgi:hypothetical protein
MYAIMIADRCTHIVVESVRRREDDRSIHRPRNEENNMAATVVETPRIDAAVRLSGYTDAVKMMAENS